MGNANSGRRPLPTALKVLRGNPGRGKLNANEPRFDLVSPAFDEPPAELGSDEQAEAEWRRLAPLLRGARILTIGDRSALVALCQMWSTYLEAAAGARLGLIEEDAKGKPIASPYVKIADSALTQCRALWNELGLTPASRSKIAALPAADARPADKWAGLLS